MEKKSVVELKRKYYSMLRLLLLLLKHNDLYSSVCKQYIELREKINKKLTDIDAMCVDAERYIDKSTGAIRENVGFELDSEPELKEMLGELSRLYLEKRRLGERYNWDDELYRSVHVVVKIAECEDFERKIIDELGREEGEIVIYEAKKEVLRIERELEMVFFAPQVERMEALFKLRVLFPTEADITVTQEDYLDFFGEQTVVLKNKKGEKFSFAKYAQITYRGCIYLELELLEDMNIKKFVYYKLDSEGEEQRLTLVEDEATERELDKRRDRLEVEQAKKKK